MKEARLRIVYFFETKSDKLPSSRQGEVFIAASPSEEEPINFDADIDMTLTYTEVHQKLDNYFELEKAKLAKKMLGILKKYREAHTDLFPVENKIIPKELAKVEEIKPDEKS